MNFKFEEKLASPTVGQYHIIVEGTDLAKFREKAEYQKIKKIKLAGFREGSVPRELALEKISKEEIEMEIYHEVFEAAMKYIQENNALKHRPITFGDIIVPTKEIVDNVCRLVIEFSVIPQIDVSK